MNQEIQYIKNQIKSINHKLDLGSYNNDELKGQKIALINMAFSLYNLNKKELHNLKWNNN